LIEAMAEVLFVLYKGSSLDVIEGAMDLEIDSFSPSDFEVDFFLPGEAMVGEVGGCLPVEDTALVSLHLLDLRWILGGVGGLVTSLSERRALCR